MRILASGIVLLLAGVFSLSADPLLINGYLIGSPPPGAPEVLDALNKSFESDLNARLELDYIDWNEVNSKYPLLLSGEEGVDWIFTADWAQYTTQTVRGAFRELTPDMLRRYMPRHWVATPKDAWEAAKVNGKIYMIPTATPDRKVPLAVIRGDLRKKLGIPPITSVRDLEPYLAAVRQHYPDIIPINLGNGYDIGQPFFAVLYPDIPPILSAFFGLIYGKYEDPQHGLLNLLDQRYRPAFLKAAATMKRWYDSGYLSRAPFANPVLSKQSFAQGRSAVGFGNSQDIQSVLTLAESKGYDPEIIPILSSTGHSAADPYTGNGVAIAMGCKNLELTLKMLDLLMENPSYEKLAYFGIEGRDYKLMPDNKVAILSGRADGFSLYPIDAAGFWFLDKKALPPLENWPASYVRHQALLDSYLVPNSFQNFTFVPNKVKNEIADITTVMDQYWSPIAIGAVSNPDKAISLLEEKLKAARLDRAEADLRAQLYVFEHGQR